MRAGLLLYRVETFITRRWRVLAALCAAIAAGYLATTVSDEQGRADLPLGYAVRMTCEDDPESYLWSGACERIAADIALTEKPTFFELTRAFVRVHHTQIPAPATVRRFAGVPCDPAFDLGKALKGTRYILAPELFENACSPAYAQAVMDEVDARDRALLTIERAGLSWQALAAGAFANLTEPLVLLGAAFVVLALWLL